MQVSDDAKNFLGGGEGRRVAPSRIFFAQNLLAAALWTQKIFFAGVTWQPAAGLRAVRGADRRDKVLVPGYSGMTVILTGCSQAGATRPLQPLKRELPQGMKETGDGNRQHLTLACSRLHTQPIFRPTTGCPRLFLPLSCLCKSMCCSPSTKDPDPTSPASLRPRHIFPKTRFPST